MLKNSNYLFALLTSIALAPGCSSDDGSGSGTDGDTEGETETDDGTAGDDGDDDGDASGDGDGDASGDGTSGDGSGDDDGTSDSGTGTGDDTGTGDAGTGTDDAGTGTDDSGTSDGTGTDDGGTTGGAGGDEYQPCEGDGCSAADESCIADDMGQTQGNVCGQECVESSDCPASPGGEAIPECVDIPDGSFETEDWRCVLDCFDGGSELECPAGMVCGTIEIVVGMGLQDSAVCIWES